MKIALKVTAILLLLSITVIQASADSGHGWYISKRPGCTPGFPEDARFLEEHHCYFIDRSCEKSGDKVIYLTFDAGYENGNVEKILDTLRDKSVPAAFFILSNLISKNTELVKRMFDEGHSVSNHTKKHKAIPNLSNKDALTEISELEELCFEKTGRNMEKYFRYPEGFYSKESALLLEDAGYNTFFWSIAYADWDNTKQPTREYAIESLKNQTHPGAVVLLHPTSATNADILADMIDIWRDMGYRFGTLAQLISNN